MPKEVRTLDDVRTLGGVSAFSKKKLGRMVQHGHGMRIRM